MSLGLIGNQLGHWMPETDSWMALSGPSSQPILKAAKPERMITTMMRVMTRAGGNRLTRIGPVSTNVFLVLIDGC